MKTASSLFLLIFLILTSYLNCARNPSLSSYPAISQSRPKMVAILPISNNTANNEIDLFIQKEIASLLEKLKWPIQKPENTNKLILEGYQTEDGSKLNFKNKSKLSQYIGADGLFYFTLSELDTSQIGANKTITIDIEVTLFNGMKNFQLWQNHQRCLDFTKTSSSGAMFTQVSNSKSQNALKNCLQKLFGTFPFYK